MIPANDDAMSSIDLFLKSISEIILESKPKKTISSTETKDKKKSIKAKKVLKTTEVKKVSSDTTKDASKQTDEISDE